MRCGVATASIRILPFCWIASVVYDIVPATWPPSTDETRSPVPLNGTYSVAMPKSRLSRACAT